ncbi:hypothetical protein [Sphingobacterium siyangense]|uniref:hypothetical protein n=1 Tax=Sphingobacterium siyangense TaxID=459529 RepID=UPI0019631386|nr:hypothetical protein [Sphingobacterium siyangense]QRY59721.1 hypothetical protein JVX97_09905 [Sphingobacterium siyangense]
MGNFNKYLCLLGLVFLMSACKTEKNEVFPRIINEAITSVRDKEISMTYQISSLGYTKSGVRYYKKDNPSQGKSVEAVREGDMFRLTLNELDSESTYILVPYIEYNGNTIESERKTEITTTAPFPEDFTLFWPNTEAEYDERGQFRTVVEGKNLNNINLRDIKFLFGMDTLHMNYPIATKNGTYQISLTGYYPYRDGNYMLRVIYKEKEIIGQAIDFIYKGNTLAIGLKKTNWRTNYPSICNDQIYYFWNNSVSHFDPETSRLQNIAHIPDTMGVIPPKSVSIGNRIFFLALPVSHILPSLEPDLFNGYELFCQAFDIEKREFSKYYFSRPQLKESHGYSNHSIFVHNNAVYQTYTLTVNSRGIKNIVAKYNPTKDKFEEIATFDTNFSSECFVSVKGRLYALGISNVFDQGFNIGYTLTIYAVDANTFKLTELYRVGTTNQTYPYAPVGAINFNGDILLALDVNNFMMYNIVKNTLSPIYLSINGNHMYFGGMFTYKDKYYLNADINFLEGSIYEMSIQ